MAKTRGNTRTGNASSPEGFNPIAGYEGEPLRRISDNDILVERNRLRDGLKDDWQKESSVHSIIAIGNQRLYAEYDLRYDRATSEWTETLTIRSGDSYAREQELIERPVGRKKEHPTLREAQELINNELPELLREYNRRRNR